MDIRPYNWCIIGPWLRRRANNDGATIANGMYCRGYHPARIHRYANREIIRATAQHNDAKLHFYMGMAVQARELENQLEGITP